MAITLIYLLLIPLETKAQRRVNRYILTGELDFIYRRYSKPGEAQNFFEQRYNLNLAGAIWDPRFMVFSSGVTFRNTDVYNTTEQRYEIWNYDFTTTFFPRFRFPLTLYLNRTTSENTIEQVTNRYGFRWNLIFRRLPTTRLFFDKTDTSASNRDEERFSFGMDMTKGTKNTDNRFHYTGTISDDDISRVNTYFHAVSFNNRTRLTRTTFLGLRGNYFSTSVSSPTAESRTDTLSARIDLSLRPSKRLQHFYYYNVSRRDTTEEVGEGMSHEFAGTLNYQMTERLSLREGISYIRSDYPIGPIRTAYKRFRLDSGATYRLTKRLSTFGDIIYSDQEWYPASTVTGESSLKLYDLKVGLEYVRPIIRGATLSSRYAVGVNSADSDRFGTTTRLSNSFNAGIMGMKFRSFILSTDYGLSLNTAVKEDTYRFGYHEKRVENLNIDITSIGLRFLTLAGTYSYYNLDSFIDTFDEDSQRLKIIARSTVIKRTNITASYGYSNISRGTLERTQTNSFDAGINHFVPVWRGNLNLHAGYGTSIGRSKSVTTRATNITYEGRYSARVRRNLNMELKVSRIESRFQTTWLATNTFKSSFIYRLRAWLLNMDYEYIVREYTNTPDITENRFMVRARRGFARLFRF